MMGGMENETATLGPKYMNILQQVANRQLDTIVVDLDDLKKFLENKDAENGYGNGQVYTASTANYVNDIVKNTAHYTELFSQAADNAMPEPTIDLDYTDSVLDVILHQRQQRNESVRQQTAAQEAAISQSNAYGAPSINFAENSSDPFGADGNAFPPQLTRRYCLYIKPPSEQSHSIVKPLAVRDMKAELIGNLITLRGIVTRVSDVKPAVQVNAYRCDRCGAENFQEVKSKNFMPLLECRSQRCIVDKVKGRLYMLSRASKFMAFQEARVQELSNQVPIGHIPRSISIHLTGNIVRSLSPGDVVDVSGIFTPTPLTGWRANKGNALLTETFIEAQYVHQHKKQYDNLELTPAQLQLVETLHEDPLLYEKLAKSIAPEIYGMEDVKKALLLLLVGGVTKEMGDGMRIRGDINICLMGDPGVAKSQLLKYISKVAPRGVYTTGRGSSGVGLTAAVMRDPVTDEMILEGGALVLADNGVCTIDEFDKMDDTDRTAIHEVMEQQTISIAKAGISTTLNARASILAAANPLYGRYNPKLSPVENINLPAALLSRFDLVFLLLDTPDRSNDERLARHVAYVHMHGTSPHLDFEPVPPAVINQYISRARQYRPTVPKEVADHVVAAYVKMRQHHQKDANTIRQFSHITPRSFLGIMRLAQAHARLRFSSRVSYGDVEEALRLIDVCKSSLETSDGRDHIEFDSGDVTSKIYRIVRDLAYGDGSQFIRSWNMATIRDRVIARGYTLDQLNATIMEYTNLQLWQVTDNQTRLEFL